MPSFFALPRLRRFIAPGLLGILASVAAGAARTVELDEVLVQASALKVRLPTRAGVRYQLRVSEELSTWADAGSPIAGDGAVHELSLDAPAGQRFVRIEAELDTAFPSTTTGITYPVHVYLPPGYEDSGKEYPVIYATDGQWVFDGFSGAIAARHLEIILIALEQGPGDRRAIDYTWPGAQTYFQFLRDEFMPVAESLYRIDPARRTISGTSYGGLFVGVTLLLDDPFHPTFKNYLCFDGSFYYASSTITSLEAARYEANPAMNVTLFLTSATAYPNNHAWVNWFEGRLRDPTYSGFTLIRQSFPVVHNDVAQPSFEAALDALF